jgi:hypothetical protein
MEEAELTERPSRSEGKSRELSETRVGFQEINDRDFAGFVLKGGFYL